MRRSVKILKRDEMLLFLFLTQRLIFRSQARTFPYLHKERVLKPVLVKTCTKTTLKNVVAAKLSLTTMRLLIPNYVKLLQLSVESLINEERLKQLRKNRNGKRG